MSTLSQIVYFLLVVSLYFIKTQNLAEVKLIISYVKNQNYSQQVTLFSCLNKRETYLVYREITKQNLILNIFTNYSRIDAIYISQHTFIIVNGICPNFTKFLEQAEKLKLLQNPYKWLILYGNEKEIPSSTNLLIDSHFAIASKISDNQFYLQLVYKSAQYDTHFKTNDIGVFSLNDGFEYYNKFLIARNRSDLMGSNLTVSYVLTNPDYPFDIIDYRFRHIESYSKLSYALVYHLLDMLNCTKIFIWRDSWGYKPQNATHFEGGMFGDIEDGTAEIGGTVSFYTVDRMSLVDYLSATTPSDLKFILRAPPLSYVNNLFTLPFDVNVWYCLYFVIVATVLIMYVIVKCESRYEKALKKRNNINSIKPKFFDVILLQIEAITQQGSDNEPKSMSGRIAVFTVFLVLMFLYTSYSANIVVLLQSTSASIRTVEDLLNSKITLGVDDIIYNRHYFKLQQEPIRKAIYERKIAPKNQKTNFMSVEAGIKKVKDEFFAFHVETTSGYKEIMDTFKEHEKCGLIEIDYLNVLYPSITIRKNSPYKKVVKVGFRKIHESGIRHRQMNRIYYKKPHCISKGGSFKSVGIIDVYFPVEIFLIGCVVAIWFLIIEIVFRAIYNIKKRQSRLLIIKIK